MAYEEKKYDNDEHFEFALRERDGKKIHISEVLPDENGKKGYRCLGTNCGNELIAISIRKNPKHKPYFKHAPINFTKGEKGCIFSNKQYRENLASAILTGHPNRVKVPSVYKINPNNFNKYKLIQESKYIHAHYAQSQVTFYEDMNGEVTFSKKPNVDEKYLIRKFDVVFFDKDDKPILLIELTDTNKLEDAKIADLYRIGIDTIQINIPKTSEKDIEKVFHTIKNTQWVYNEREANTDYLQIPESNYSRVLEVNELESRLFKESYSCRVFRIKELIRGIGNCLESEQYSDVGTSLNEQLSGVRENTKREREELGDLEESNRREALGRNSIEEDNVRKQQADLERRYFAKDIELSNAFERTERERSSEQRISSEIRNCRKEISRIEDRGRRLEQSKFNFQVEIEERVSEEFSETFEREKREISEIDEQLKNIDEQVRNTINRDIGVVQWDIEDFGVRNRNLSANIFEEFRKEIEAEKSEIERINRRRATVKGELYTVENDVRAYFEEAEETERREYQEEINRIEKEINTIEFEEISFEEEIRIQFDKDLESNPKQFTEELRTLLESKRILDDYIETECEEARYKRLQKLFKKGAGL